MAQKLDGRPGSEYDDDWEPSKTPSDDLENLYNAPSATDEDLPEGHPSRSTSPEALKAAEEKAGEEGSKTGADNKEVASLEDRLQAAGEGFKKADEDAGFFKADKAKKKPRSILSRVGKKRALLIGGGLGLGLIGGLIGLFSFLNVFRLDHILSTLDQQTFARFNASFEGRSDAWFRSYLRIRMAEIEGTISPADENGNVYFRANQVDDDNPVRDWYRTMRTSSFEDDLLRKQGIRFTSALDADGNIKLARITINNRNVDIDPGEFRENNIGDVNFNNFLSQIDGEFDVKLFGDANGVGGNREARRAIKAAVNDNTKKHQVFRRRHLRKDIANMTGVREWRLFEKSRDKIDNAKISIQRKIMNKVFSGDSNSLRFLNCLLSGTRCPNTTDPVDPENRVTATPTGNLQDEGNRGEGEQYDADGNLIVDEDGNPIHGINGDNITREASEAVVDGTQNLTEDFTPTEQITKNVVSAVSGTVGRSASYWEWAKRLASIDNLFKGGSESKAVQLVYNARMAQLVAFYATMAIGRDQIRSGELVGDELNGFYDMTKNFSNGEAWEALDDSYNSGTVSAQETTNVSKEEYCKRDHDKSFDEYAWYCDGFKPKGGSNAESVSSAYSNTIGWLIGPIADAVNGVRDIPVVGGIIDTFNDILGDIAGVFGDALLGILGALGLGDNVESIIGTATAWLLEFAGGGPFIDPGQPGFGAWVMGGAVGSAETTARSSGGTRSTVASYKYSTRVAAAYEQERLESMSWSERYLSLENPDSVAAGFAFSLSNVTAGENLARKFAGGLVSAPATLFGAFTNPVGAQSSDIDLAALAGVNTYDIPQQCMELDPLDPEYLQKATNATIPNLSYAILNNGDTFWQAVYDDRNPQTVDKEQVYNCALLDQRVRGGMGYLYGYSQDNGYEDGSTTPTNPTTDSGIIGDPFSSSVDVPCAANTIDLGIHTAYNDGQALDMRLCGIPNLRSTSSESSSGSDYYIEGAAGIGIVNSRVSGAVYTMVETAKTDNIVLVASSTFRSKEHQEALWANNPNSTYVARPGYSNHQSGVAIDFQAGGVRGGPTCAQRARAPSNPSWNWLFTNAERFGYKQYSAESWHWDTSTANNRCDSSQ